MKKLPRLERTVAAVEDRHRLALWLREWQIDRALAGAATAAAGGAGARLSVAHAPDGGDADARVGQVRLLAPDAPAARARPLYLALLRRERANAWTVAPFGRFAVPALPGEWRGRERAPGVSILCLWNARRIDGERLARSWAADALSAADLADALAVLDYVERGMPLPAAVVPRTGPPLIHPADPRWDYIEEETRLLDGLAAAVTVDREALSPAADTADALALPIAAETRAAYGGTRRLRVDGLALVLDVQPQAEVRIVSVRDASGSVSGRLNGYALVAVDGRRSLPFWRGQSALAPAFSLAGATLRGPRGDIVKLYA